MFFDVGVGPSLVALCLAIALAKELRQAAQSLVHHPNQFLQTGIEKFNFLSSENAVPLIQDLLNQVLLELNF